MNKLKKILSVVLSIGLVASTLVLPITAEAASVNFIHKVTFDEAADATGVFGTGDGYQVVAGTDPTAVHGSATNRAADDKLAKLSVGYTGTVADGSAGSYLFGKNWGDTTGVKHATLQFDIQFTNTYNTFTVYPAGNGNNGAVYRYGFEMVSGPDAAKPIEALHNSWDNTTGIATLDRLKWHQFAIEYDLNNGVAKLYLDGSVIDTWDGISGDATPDDFMVKFTPDNGVVYLDDIFYYEGGYQNVTLPIFEYDFTEAADATELENTTQADGLMGKDASDKVGLLAGATNDNNWGKYYTDDVVTAEAQVYVPSGKKTLIYPGSNANGEDRPGVYIQNGKFGYVNGVGWVYTDICDIDKDMWHKIAIQWNKTAATADLYLDGVKMYTWTGLTYASNGTPADIRLQDGGYVDNFRAYVGAYKVDAAITATSTSKVTVDGTTLKATEGVTADELKAAVTADSVKFYTDTTLATEVSDPANAGIMLVNYGELYKKYDLSIESPYSTKSLWLDFTAAADSTKIGATQKDGFAGKAASDKIGQLPTATTRNILSSVASTAGVVTYEASVFMGSGNEGILHVFNDRASSHRNAVKFRTNGSVVTSTTLAGAGIWDDLNNNNLSHGTYNANTWNKVAMEWNAAAKTVKFYLNGSLIREAAITAEESRTSFNGDFGFAGVSGTSYVDNMRVYAAPYVADATITAPTGAADGKLVVTEGSTLAQVKAMVTDGTAEVYKSDLTTVSSTLANGDVLIINKGELYDAYVINLASAYDPMYIDYDFAEESEVTTFYGNGSGGPFVWTNGFAGKATTDKVAQVVGHSNSNGWGAYYTDDVITAEAQVYVPSGKVEIYPGSNPNGEGRPGVYIQNGKFGYVSGGDWTYTDLCDVDTTIWHKIAIQWNKTTSTADLYLDGVKMHTWTGLTYASNGINKDIRVQNNGYVDNFRVYGAAYVQDATIATPSAVADGKFVIADGQTLAEAAATVTDGTAKFYTDNTYATEATSTANAAYVLINKGELYVAYPVKVASKYDGALLSTNFNAGSVDYTGDFAGNAASSWVICNTGMEDKVTYSYTQPGGKDSKAWTVTNQGSESTINTRIQTGWGNANSKYSSGVYTVEAQIYNVTGAKGGAITLKMRNASGGNLQFQVWAPDVAHKWYKLALTVDTVNKTVKGYINGEEATVRHNNGEADSLTVDGVDYTIVSDQANLGAGEHTTNTVTTAFDNFRVYSGAYKGDTMPTLDASVTMASGATVADVLTETGADFVVDTNGDVVTSGAVATGYMAVKQNGEVYAYCDVTVTAPEAPENEFGTLATGTVYEKDGVEYVFVAVTTGTIDDISLYDTFRVTDGVDVKEIALSELMGTTLTGAAEIGVLVKNVPAANKDNFQAKLVLAD